MLFTTGKTIFLVGALKNSQKKRLLAYKEHLTRGSNSSTLLFTPQFQRHAEKRMHNAMLQQQNSGGGGSSSSSSSANVGSNSLIKGELSPLSYYIQRAAANPLFRKKICDSTPMSDFKPRVERRKKPDVGGYVGCQRYQTAKRRAPEVCCEVLFMSQNPLFPKESKIEFVAIRRPFTAIKHYFYWGLKSPLRKSGSCDIRNTSAEEECFLVVRKNTRESEHKSAGEAIPHA
jgi:hypothetical protein